MTVRLRPRPGQGPALRRTRVPYVSLALSTVAHGGLIAGLLAAAATWGEPPTTYVVNLVPAVAAPGVPQGRPTPAPAPRPQPPAPRAEPKEPPRRAPEPPRPAEPVDLPSRNAQASLPSRSQPHDLPTRAIPPREPAPLPDLARAPRPPALPRPGEKELPTVAAQRRPDPLPSAAVPAPAASPAPPPSTPAPLPAREAPRPAPPPPPPAAPPLGRPGGSPQGSGALTLDVGDFPFAWYLRELQARITQRWQPPGRTEDGARVVIVFEIGRDGKVLRSSVEQSSGNFLYDQAALRAVAEAAPFRELPPEFKAPLLRVHLGFHYTNRG